MTWKDTNSPKAFLESFSIFSTKALTWDNTSPFRLLPGVNPLEEGLWWYGKELRGQTEFGVIGLGVSGRDHICVISICVKSSVCSSNGAPALWNKPPLVLSSFHNWYDSIFKDKADFQTLPCRGSPWTFHILLFFWMKWRKGHCLAVMPFYIAFLGSSFLFENIYVCTNI